MAGTRSQKSSPVSTQTNGTKRKADDASEKTPSKRPAKGQKTLEETLPADEDVAKEINEPAKSNGDANGNGRHTNGDADKHKSNETKQSTETVQPKATEQPDANGESKNALDQVKADAEEAGTTSKQEDSKQESNGTVEGTAIVEDEQREKAQPSNIMEKGIIYFFTRGRVGVEDPNSVTDLQRSFFVLRPLPDGAKLTEGAIQDDGNNRLIALPKKVFPKSGADKFMVFVEKSKTTMEDLNETFFQGSTYSTKTTGTRHTPGVEMIGEGLYAITSTGDGRTTTHLAYMLTIPQELGEVQKDIGLAEKGSFVMSVKNPKASAPSYALPATAEYPDEILDEFQGRGWLPAEPKHLDYTNTSMLLIGESFDSALEPTAEDEKKDEKEVPKEELEKLEEENEHRIENLKGDDTIFEDLGVSSKEYGLKSTW